MRHGAFECYENVSKCNLPSRYSRPLITLARAWSLRHTGAALQSTAMASGFLMTFLRNKNSFYIPLNTRRAGGWTTFCMNMNTPCFFFDSGHVLTDRYVSHLHLPLCRRGRMRDEKGSHRSWIERELRCLSLGAQLNVESIDNPFDRAGSQQYVSTRQGR